MNSRARTLLLRFPRAWGHYGLVMLLGLLVTSPGAIPAESVRIRWGGRPFTLLRSHVLETWPRLEVGEQRRAAGFVVEWAFEESARRPALLQLLEGSADPVVRAFGRSAARVLEGRATGRAEALTGHEANLTTFLSAVAEIRKKREPQSEALVSICRVPGQEALCDLSRFVTQVRAAAASPKVDQAVLRDILRWGIPFLSREPLRPPFALPLAESTPRRLFSLGLPLEAAMLADRMADGPGHPLRSEVPYYLTGAGDFDAARRYTDAYPHKSRAIQLNAELDWLTLSGDYRGAIERIVRHGPEAFAPYEMTRFPDYWTDFKMRPEVVRLRLALLLYLAGDKRKAVSALESLREFSGTVYRGEPEKYLARLRLAQFVLRDNPALAQKIAEDISYLAQEKDWRILEYNATLLDGWANYHLKNYYAALICFTKAGGILRGEDQQYANHYSHLMGRLAVRIGMHPKGNHSDLIEKINALLVQRPYNEAVFTIREWTPIGLGPEFFLNQAIGNLEARGDRWGALNLLLEHARAGENFFAPGRNPGGLRGFVMGVQWSREAARIPYLAAWAAERPVLTAGSVAHAADAMPKVGARSLKSAAMQSRSPRLFSFSVGSDRLLYLTTPSSYVQTSYRTVRRGRKKRRVAVRRRVETVALDLVRLPASSAAELARSCSTQRRSCEGPTGVFAPLAEKVSGATSVHVQFDPEFDIDYRHLLQLKAKSALLYFYGADGARARAEKSRAVQYARGCPTDLARDLSASPGDFPVLFSTSADKAGIWLWPVGLDEPQTRAGASRPVYLRNFLCGDSALRFWEMDRFSGGQPPSIVIFRRRTGEVALNRAFARHFAERGTILVEVDPTASSTVRRMLDAMGNSVSADGLLSAYRKQGAPESIRIILPGVLDG